MFDIKLSGYGTAPDLDIVDENAHRQIPKIKVHNSFDLKSNKKKYLLHQVEFPGTWQIDLMFSKNNCFLVTIEVNTRYLYVERTNLIIPELNPKTNKYIGKEVKKSAVAIACAMYKMMAKGWNPSLIVSDSELALDSNVIRDKIYKPYKIKHRTVALVTDEDGRRTSNHTSLGIVDRVIRTLKRWVYDRGWSNNILPNDEVIKFVRDYNTRPHRTLSEIFEQDTTPYDVHNDFKKEVIVIQHFLEKNNEQKKNKPFMIIPDGSIVKVYNQPNAFGKRTRIAREIPYEVVSHYNNIYTIRNTVTGKIEQAPRIYLERLAISKKDLY